MHRTLCGTKEACAARTDLAFACVHRRWHVRTNAERRQGRRAALAPQGLPRCPYPVSVLEDASKTKPGSLAPSWGPSPVRRVCTVLRGAAGRARQKAGRGAFSVRGCARTAREGDCAARPGSGACALRCGVSLHRSLPTARRLREQSPEMGSWAAPAACSRRAAVNARVRVDAAASVGSSPCRVRDPPSLVGTAHSTRFT